MANKETQLKERVLKQLTEKLDQLENESVLEGENREDAIQKSDSAIQKFARYCEASS